MKCVILQPSYIPWRGLFHQIQKADVFVFYDDVPYDRRGWRNRNRIKGPNGAFWLTVPIHSKGLRSAGRRINEVRIDWEQPWSQKHLESILHTYRRAPFLSNYEPLLREVYARHDEWLADLTIDFTVALALELGILDTEFLRSSSLGVEGRKSERLLAILRKLGSDHYITGPSASSYLDEALFTNAGIALEYMSYDYPEYEQPFPPFDPQVSILDLLLVKGPEAPRYIWGSERSSA